MKPIALTRFAHALLLAFCLSAGTAAAMAAAPFFQAYVIVGENGKAVARAVTSAARCPEITVDSAAPVVMEMRAAAALMPNRGSLQQDSKAADFPVSVCDAAIPAGVRKIAVAGVPLPVPTAQPQRILLIGDTGCRQKASESAAQPCNDADAWPFAAISKLAAAWRPDLVVHLGDIIYRESPCPAGSEDCAGSPWGYGLDSWNADFFQPAQALLRAAPWLVVRGNHESCARAGQGWFRFLEPRPYESKRSCDDPVLDREGDYTAPYAVPLAADAQFIVFDSSKAAGKPYAPADEAYTRYATQLRWVDELARSKPHTIFLSHHPVLGFASGKNQTALPGNQGLQSVMRSLHPDRLFAANIDLAMHGHVHLFEAISFKSDHPAVFVGGNSGSDLSQPLPASLPQDAQPAPGAMVDEYFGNREFGFLTMERIGGTWKFTEWNRHGNAVLHCDLVTAKMHCVASGAESK